MKKLTLPTLITVLALVAAGCVTAGNDNAKSNEARITDSVDNMAEEIDDQLGISDWLELSKEQVGVTAEDDSVTGPILMYPNSMTLVDNFVLAHGQGFDIPFYNVEGAIVANLRYAHPEYINFETGEGTPIIGSLREVLNNEANKQISIGDQMAVKIYEDKVRPIAGNSELAGHTVNVYNHNEFVIFQLFVSNEIYESEMVFERMIDTISESYINFIVDRELGGKESEIKDVDSWQTYTNIKHNYTIMYPKKTAFQNRRYAGDLADNQFTKVHGNTYGSNEKESDSVYIGWGPDTFFKIDFMNNASDLTVFEYIDQEIDKTNESVDLNINEVRNSSKEMLLSGINGYEFISGKCCIESHGLNEGVVRYIYLPHSKTEMLRISYPITNDLDDYHEEHAQLFEKMLATFKIN